jgi:hypothetical protein
MATIKNHLIPGAGDCCLAKWDPHADAWVVAFAPDVTDMDRDTVLKWLMQGEDDNCIVVDALLVSDPSSNRLRWIR